MRATPTPITLAFSLALALAVVPTLAAAGGDWNDAGIAWKSYEDGLAEAKKTNKPVVLIFYTDWCPHCTRYSGVFHDSKVVDAAKQFVMIRLNKDQNQEVSAKYAPDGEYIPRTYFLASDGTLQSDIHEKRDRYLYFYDASDAGALLRGMDEAREKLGAKSQGAAADGADKG